MQCPLSITRQTGVTVVCSTHIHNCIEIIGNGLANLNRYPKYLKSTMVTTIIHPYIHYSACPVDEAALQAAMILSS